MPIVVVPYSAQFHMLELMFLKKYRKYGMLDADTPMATSHMTRIQSKLGQSAARLLPARWQSTVKTSGSMRM